MRLEQLKPARFDESMREQMQQEALTAFLKTVFSLCLQVRLKHSSPFNTTLNHERTAHSNV